MITPVTVLCSMTQFPVGRIQSHEPLKAENFLCLVAEEEERPEGQRGLKVLPV